VNTYQVRLNEEQSLKRLTETLALEISSLLETASELQPFKQRMRDAVVQELTGFFDSLIRTYTGCGRNALCDCGLVATSWAEDGGTMNPKPLNPHQAIKRLILDVPTHLEDFLKDIRGTVARAVFGATGGSTWPVQSLQNPLDALIKTFLGRFIFRSPVCGQAFICMNRKAVNPWKAPAVLLPG